MSDFKPNWVSPPCNTIHDVLRDKRMTPYKFRLLMRLTPDETQGLLTSKVPITKDMARRLSRVLGASTGFWVRREANYTKECTRLNIKR